MMTRKVQLGRWFAVGILVLLSVACGGGGGSSNEADDNGGNTDDTTDDVHPSLQNVNGTLSGVYFSTTALNEGEWLNLKTGETGAFYEYDDNIPSGLEAIVPSQDGTEYLELYVDDPSFRETTSTVLIKDMRTGLVADEFTVTGAITGTPRSLRFSPDRQIISVRRDEYDDFDYRLTFYKRTGEFIAEFDDLSVSEYTWLPDGRFAFFKAGELHIGELRGPNDIVSHPVVSIAHLDGWPQNLSVSPTKELKFAFEMATGAPILFETSNYRDATVWRVNGDGSDLHQVATMADYDGSISDEPRVNNPLWSLDGNYLMMSVGVSSSIAVIWEEQYSPVTDDYEPVYVSDVITAKSEGFMYLLPEDTRDIVFLGEQSFPVIGYNNAGAPYPYEISSLHIEPGAMLIEAVTPLEETVVTPSNGLSGSLIYLKDWYEDEYDDKLTIMRYDTASGQEQILWQIAGENFDDDRYFSISADGQRYAHWNEISYDDKVLRIYDASGQELKHYQLVYEDYPETKGKKLLSSPRFSPVNNNLLMYRFVDESDDEAVKFGVLDWTTGSYVMMYEGEFDSVAWEPDGSITASINKEIHRFAYQNGSFAEPVLLFTTPNAAKYLDVSADGSKYLFTMSGRIFWCLADGSGLTQVTAPPATGLEYWPAWSPDGLHITFMKDSQRYVISADSHNLRIGLNVSNNASKAMHITREGGSTGYWRP
jgi:Tol biopolymer transport system component